MYNYLHMYKISSIRWAIGGSAVQRPQVPRGRAPNQPTPHPSDKLYEGIM